jgi:thymidylate synthase (FAD)
MRLINSSYEIIEQEPGILGCLKLIEKAKRVCYKSENKITDDSYVKAVQGLIDNRHGAMLEHGTVYLQDLNSDQYRTSLLKYKNHKYSVFKSEYLGKDHCQGDTDYHYNYYVTTNYRVLTEHHGWLDDLKYVCEPVENCHTKRVTVRFILDRGISHEFVRHRVFSFAQESSRYCNYSSNKFDKNVTFILPTWLDWVNRRDNPQEDRIYDYFVHSLETAERQYFHLLDEGWQPQQARAVLPNALKTELILTGTVDQWVGFFALRTAPSAHPQARELAIPLYKEFIARGYIKPEENEEDCN